MKWAYLCIVAAGASTAASARQPPVAVSNSPPPPIVAVPVQPPFPSVIVVPPTVVPPLPPERDSSRLPNFSDPGVVVVRAPKARMPAQSYIARDDYPASALARREQGKVRFVLGIGLDGRVRDCVIVASSGSSALNAATCAIMRRRARFTPAIDANGNPARAQIRQEVLWRLPSA
jgi:protein TonB